MNERREYVMNGKPFCQIKKRNYIYQSVVVFFVRVVFFLLLLFLQWMRVFYTLFGKIYFMSSVVDDDDDGIKIEYPSWTLKTSKRAILSNL